MNHQVVGYIRVSSHEQSIERQLLGIELHKKFVDIISGSTKDRPGLKSCIEYVREGDTLVVDSIDRLARNLRHLQELLTEFLQRGVIVRFIKENLTFTSNQDPMAMLMLQMMGAFAEFERSMIRSRQQEGIELAKKAGKRLGRKPQLNEKHKEQAINLRHEGLNIQRIAITMNISRPSVYKLLDLLPKRDKKVSG